MWTNLLRDFLRTIGTACIIAGTVLYFLGPSTDNAKDNGDSGKYDVEIQTLQDTLKRTKEELAKLQIATLANVQSSKDDKYEEVKGDSSSPRIVKTLLLIEADSASSSISDELEQIGIIDDANTFEDYLATNDFSNKIKIGEYMLDSSMSHNNIAKIITNTK